MENIKDQNLESKLKKNKYAVITIAVLLLASVILNVVFFVRNKNMSDANQELITEKEVIISEKEVVIETRDEFKEQLERKRIEAIDLEQKIRELEEEISQKNRSISQLRRDARDTEELDKLKEEHKKLQEEHNDLKEQYEKLEKEIAELKEKLESLQGEYDQLFEKTELADALNAYNIFERHKQYRFIFRDRYVERARRVDNTYFSFEVHGSIFAKEGEREVHLLLYDPNGNIMYPDGEVFEKDDETESTFTKKRLVDFEGEPVLLNFDIEHDERIDSGRYSIEVYIDGKLTRSKEFMLE